MICILILLCGLQFSLKVSKVNITCTSIYFVKMAVNVNNKLLLTFSLRFLFSFYLLGLFFPLFSSMCNILQNTRPTSNIHKQNQTSRSRLGVYFDGTTTKARVSMKSKTTVENSSDALCVCNMHSCKHSIPAVRMRLKTIMRNVDFVCVGHASHLQNCVKV